MCGGRSSRWTASTVRTERGTAAMARDAQGLPVTVEDPEVLAAIDRCGEGFLQQDLAAVLSIFPAVERDPDCLPAQCLAAMLKLFGGTADSPRQARPHLVAAARHAAAATERERLFLQALTAWADGARDRAIALHQEIAARWPRDLVSARLGQIHLFLQGDCAGQLALTEAVFDANRDRPYAHGMMAFALEEVGRYREAEAAGRHAVEMQRREPWAHHAVAHVMESEGRWQDGLDWMLPLAPEWEGCNSFMLTHNWWHVALFLIDGDRAEEALELFDRRVWAVDRDYAGDQGNAIALAARLEFQGVEVGPARWSDIADHLHGRVTEHDDAFLAVHFAHALARAGRLAELRQLLSNLEAWAPGAPDWCRATWLDAALPAARGMAAFALGDPLTAWAELSAARPHLHRLGCSHAQRDLFEQCWLRAAIAAGRGSEVREVLEGRARRWPAIAFHRRWVEEAAAA